MEVENWLNDPTATYALGIVNRNRERNTGKASKVLNPTDGSASCDVATIRKDMFASSPRKNIFPLYEEFFVSKKQKSNFY